MSARRKIILFAGVLSMLFAGGVSYLRAACGQCYKEVTGCYGRTEGQCIDNGTHKVTDLLDWNKCTSEGAFSTQQCSNLAKEVDCTNCSVWTQDRCSGQQQTGVTYSDTTEGADTSKSDKCSS